MKPWHILLVLSLLLENVWQPDRAISQTNASEEETSQTEEEIPPSFGTVPGIYYDPEPGLSPSLSQMEGTNDSGSVEIDYEDPNYNIERAWQRGSTPDEIVKVGDIENDPELEGVIEIEELTLREIAENGGADIETAPLKNIGLINSMTLNEFLIMFPEYENESIQNVPIIIESLENIDGVLERGRQIESESVIDEAQGRLIERFSEEELLEGVPLEEIVRGDYDGVVDEATKSALTEIVARYPELEGLPLEEAAPIISQIVLGDWEQLEERALSEAEREVIERLANDPMFENIPLDALASGDWGELVSVAEQEILAEIMRRYPELENVPIHKLFPMVRGAINGDWSLIVSEAKRVALERGTEILTRELLELVPELANIPLGALPIEELLVGDIEGLADATLNRVPSIANRYLSELGNLSQTPGTMLAIDTAMILLTGDVFGRLDIPFAGEVETPITYVLSGGTRNQVFLPEPCLERSCKHFEVVDVLTGFAGSFNGLGKVQGKAWVQGSSQDVPGGKGFLRWVNNGKERTGVPVWTTDSHVKLSLEDIDEGGDGEPATARIWLDFQVCVYPPFLGEHCIPHIFSFPTPWKVQSGGVMVVFSRSSPSDWVEYGRDRARDDGDRKREAENSGVENE